MRTPLSTDFVITERGGVVENRHAVHAAIVDSTGRLLYGVGDPTRITLARSAAKPAQALAIVETGALEKFNLTDADLALMCASGLRQFSFPASMPSTFLPGGSQTLFSKSVICTFLTSTSSFSPRQSITTLSGFTSRWTMSF